MILNFGASNLIGYYSIELINTEIKSIKKYDSIFKYTNITLDQFLSDYKSKLIKDTYENDLNFKTLTKFMKKHYNN